MPVSKNVWIAAGLGGGLFLGWLIIRSKRVATSKPPSAASAASAAAMATPAAIIPGGVGVSTEDEIRKLAGEDYVIKPIPNKEYLATLTHQLNKIILTLLRKCNGQTCGMSEKSWVSATLYAYMCGKGDPKLVTSGGYHVTLSELIDNYPISYDQLEYDFKNTLVKIGDLIGYSVGYIQRTSPYGNIWISDEHSCFVAAPQPLERDKYIDWAVAAGLSAMGIPMI